MKSCAGYSLSAIQISVLFGWILGFFKSYLKSAFSPKKRKKLLFFGSLYDIKYHYASLCHTLSHNKHLSMHHSNQLYHGLTIPTMNTLCRVTKPKRSGWHGGGVWAPWLALEWCLGSFGMGVVFGVSLGAIWVCFWHFIQNSRNTQFLDTKTKFKSLGVYEGIGYE